MEYLKCLKCEGKLILIHIGDTIDSGVCGDGYRIENYKCSKCGANHWRMDCDSWEPITIEKIQKYLILNH